MGDFGVGRKLLQKYGWKEGEGLGKPGNEGITTPIKPKIKQGKEGMGFDLAKDLVDQWWTNAYNESLNRVNIEMKATVEKNKEPYEKLVVSMSNEGEQDDGIPPSAKIRKRMLKSNFTEFSKGATLENGQMTEEEQLENVNIENNSVEVGDKSSKSKTPLTDEQLLKACGGRTCHKAARFGYKLNGKLARLAAQDLEMSKKLNKSNPINESPS